MGLLDIFRKTKTHDTFPENELERCFAKAGDDCSARKEFYVRLLWSELIVLTTEDSPHKGQMVLKENSNVQLVQLANGYLPAFMSTNRIFDGSIIKGPVRSMSMRGRDLFNLVKGCPVIINPNSKYGKVFLPQEIEDLLSGDLLERLTPTLIKRDTPIQIAQPSNYPQELLKALSDCFEGQPKVISAYLAMTRKSPNDGHLHFLIGIEIVDGDLTDISRFAEPIAEKYSKQEIVDFIQIKDDDISNYFKNETRPFYTKE